MLFTSCAGALWLPRACDLTVCTQRRLAFAHGTSARRAAELRAQVAEKQLAEQKWAAEAQQRETSTLRSALADAEAAIAAKSRLMSVMCHEVRTPLNGCLACAEMLLETPLQVIICGWF
jgi:signal transduction histidine kinase